MANLCHVISSAFIIIIIVYWVVAQCNLVHYTNVAGEKLFWAACNSDMNISKSIEFNSKCKTAEKYNYEC